MTEPTRRGAMRLLASTTLISMPAAVAMAAPRVADPDADLVTLYAEWQQIERAYVAEAEAKEPLEERYEELEPSMPAALTWHPLDGFNCGSVRETLPDGSMHMFYGPTQINGLRVNPPTKQVFVGTTEQWLSKDSEIYKAGWARIHDPKRMDRWNEVIDAYDAWRSERRALADRIGLTVARSRVEAIIKTQIDLEERIRDTPPKGLSGLIVKAKLAQTVDDTRHETQIVADLVAMNPGVL